MRFAGRWVAVLLVLSAGCGKDELPAAEGAAEAVSAQTTAPPAERMDGAPVPTRYETIFRDPVLEEIRDRDEAWKSDEGDKTAAVRKRQKAAKEKERAEERALVSSLPPDERPTR